MRIALRVDPTRYRGWHITLADRLKSDGHQVGVEPTSGTAAPGTPHGVTMLLTFERLVYGADDGQFFAARTCTATPTASADADLTIDLAGPLLHQGRGESWALLFDGEAGEAGLLATLLDGRAPVVSVAAAPGRIVASGLPAIENPQRLGAGLDAVLARAIGLCRSAIRDHVRGSAHKLPPQADPFRSGRPGSPASFGLASLSAKVAHRLSRIAGADHQWQTGWRRLDPTSADGVQGRLAWPVADYTWLRDDGQRFYADPFVFTHEGRTVLFVEEFPYATQRGLISAVQISADGPAGTPRPVLEQPYHLSYPSVFARDGAIWMIPETSGNGTIELYRAESFPDRWVLERVLVENVSAGDATLLDHAGRLYLLAATNEDGGSSWDQLSIFHASTLLGPWMAHEQNPVLIDAGAARPAGFSFHRDGLLLRPAQDCRGGYGAGLAFCRIDELTPARFAQTVVARLAPDPIWRASGAHTLNVGGGYEAVDRIGPRN